jgi:hypothetical protein
MLVLGRRGGLHLFLGGFGGVGGYAGCQHAQQGGLHGFDHLAEN